MAVELKTIKSDGRPETIIIKNTKCHLAEKEDGQYECVNCGFISQKKVDRECDVYKDSPDDIISKFGRFAKAYRKWLDAGCPVRTAGQIQAIYDDKCSPCEFFYEDQCSVCGCRIKRDTFFMNKLAWATEKCPLAAPKWRDTEAQPRESSKMETYTPKIEVKSTPRTKKEGSRTCCN